MYWLYIILFICSIVVPGFVEAGWIKIIVSREITEIVYIFFFSTLALAIYVIRDYQFVRYQRDATKKQQEVSRLVRELSASYAYIGEVNRKFEILQGVTLDIPELLNEKGENGIKKYFDALRAIRIFSRCRDFVVLLYSSKEEKIMQKLHLPGSALADVPGIFDIPQLVQESRQFIRRKGSFCAVGASGTIADTYCLAIFQRTSIQGSAVNLIRLLLLQILFLYSYGKNFSTKESRPVQNVPFEEVEKKEKYGILRKFAQN